MIIESYFSPSGSRLGAFSPNFGRISAVTEPLGTFSGSVKAQGLNPEYLITPFPIHSKNLSFLGEGGDCL